MKPATYATAWTLAIVAVIGAFFVLISAYPDIFGLVLGCSIIVGSVGMLWRGLYEIRRSR